MAETLDLKFKIGFFLHIPFPPWDIFRLFPWADEILQGMLGEYMRNKNAYKLFYEVTFSHC